MQAASRAGLDQLAAFPLRGLIADALGEYVEMGDCVVIPRALEFSGVQFRGGDGEVPGPSIAGLLPWAVDTGAPLAQ